MIDKGMRRAFGPKDKVLADMVQNHAQIIRAAAQSGGEA